MRADFTDDLITGNELEKTNNKKYLFIHPEEIQKEYPIPSAFEKYMKLI